MPSRRLLRINSQSKTTSRSTVVMNSLCQTVASFIFIMELTALTVKRAIRVTPALRATKATKATLVQLALRDLKAHRVLRVRKVRTEMHSSRA